MAKSNGTGVSRLGFGSFESAPVDRFRRVSVDGQLVTLRHLRLWMAAIPAYPGPEGSDRWWRYVRNYGVPRKIARHLNAETFYRTVLEGLMQRRGTDRQTIRFVQRAAGALK